MTIRMTVYMPDGSENVVETTLTSHPSLKDIKAVLEQIFGDAYTEHVTVLVNGQRTDMFVDEDGMRKGMARNEKATVIYRNNWLTQRPNTDPEMLAFIVGPAVVFSQRIWY